jgi:serine/threonine-protein kinase
MSKPTQHSDTQVPDASLIEAYEEAMRLDQKLFDAICPNYVELKNDQVRYENETLIGQGALKNVYKVFDRHSTRWVALARLREKRGLEYYDDFIHEARLITSLSHPNIIKVHEIGIDSGGQPFFTMDLKGENTLAKVIQEKKCSRSELINAFMKICDAIAYAHSQGIIHLDLKPENIQCNKFGEILVCDWGLGERVNAHHENETLIDDKNFHNSARLIQIQGSPGYMAPEQAIPNDIKDTRTDVYALGCILYTILTGEPPFSGNKDEILTNTRQSKIIPPREKCPQRRIPRSLNAIAMKALERNRNKRYDSVTSLQADIRKYLSGYATKAEKPNFIREAHLFYRRNRLPVSITIVAAVLITAGAALYLQDLQAQRLKTLAERERAESLLSTADQLYSKYTLLEETTQATNEALARRLAEAARRLKNYGIFDQPIATMEQAVDLTKIAINLDPDSPEALWQLFSQHCLRLNYKAALALPLDGYKELDYYHLAEAFPEYNFSSNHPPSAADLMALIEAAQQIEQPQQAHLERVLVYQCAMHPNLKDFDQVILSYLRLLNKDRLITLECDYDPSNKHLEFSASDSITPKSIRGSSSNRNIFRLLPIKSLELDIQGTLQLSALEQLEVSTLDLRKCKQVQVDRNVDLHQLRTIYIRKGQLNPKTLRRFIRSKSEFEIIEGTENYTTDY